MGGGGVPRPQRQMDGFREVVNICGFKDLGYSGLDFTWCNMQEGENRVYLRLDRALATNDWINHFNGTRVLHLVDSTSDHCALLIVDSLAVQPSRKRRFHFEEMWTKKKECKEIIRNAWVGGLHQGTPGSIATCLQNCAADLERWNKLVFGYMPKQIQCKRKALNVLTLQDRNGVMGKEINSLRREINDLLDCEENLWHQRSRILSYGLGDCNTKFFHSRALQRRKKNSISDIWDEYGNWCDTNESIAAAAISYFETLFTTAHPSRMSEVTDMIPTRVTDEMNQKLISTFTRDEVEAALKQMHPTKAPGPDGMSAIFFQKYWDVVENDIMCMVLNVLNSNMSIADINRANITLIPKINSPSRMSDFRPISLCNVVYKLVSKILANRLKIILSQIISENQSAFELMHYLEHKKEGKENFYGGQTRYEQGLRPCGVGLH